MQKRTLCKSCGIIIAALLLHTAMWAAAPTQRKTISNAYPTKYKIWGGDPLQSWQNGLLSGNGKMGVIVFGDPLKETVVYCDRKFFWPPDTKTPERTFNTVSPADLKTIRDLCTAEKWAEANKLAHDVHGWKGGGEGSKHPGYAMRINIPEDGKITNYLRECDFRTGEIIVKWTDNRGNWERRTFVSREDNVIVQYLAAPSGGVLNCDVQLGVEAQEGMRFNYLGMFDGYDHFAKISDDNFLNIRADYPAKMGDAGYEGVTKIIVNGGTKSVSNNVLTISNANSLLLLTKTDQYRAGRTTEWNKKLLQSQLDDIAAISTDYNTLLQRHIAIHQPIYDRVFLDLNASEYNRALPNETLLAAQKSDINAIKALWERIFDSGRYLFLSSSSEYSPPDLCGLWTGDIDGGWGGTYHLDANLNLQIGGGNIGDMPEAMEGYFTFIERLAPGFRVNATKLLGCRGMLGGGNSAGWSGLISTIEDAYYTYQYVTGEMGWLLYPFWEHYLVTGDEEFLKNRLYPLLKEMGWFYEDFLVNKDANGKYIFAGSVSPENKPSNVPNPCSVVNNATFDIAGAKFCLETLITICNKYGYDQGVPGEGVERWTEILNSLPPYIINTDGALAEWSWPGLKDNYGHRHSSHMISTWPLNQISKEETPALYTAAQETLNRKDGGNYENSGHGYLMSGYSAANLNNATAVNNKILHLLKRDYYFPTLATSHDPSFSVFCTDVVHGVPGILMEMLVNSKNQVIELLPAVPESLKKGSVSGIKTRNRVTINDLTWDMTKAEITCHLTSDINQDITLIQRKGITDINGSNVTILPSVIGNEARTIQLQAGQTAEIVLKVNKVLIPRNLALKKPVTVSASHPTDCSGGPCNGEFAVDGESTTRWASPYADDQWISIDLGDQKYITEICLRWEAAYAKKYKLQISNTGNEGDWTDIHTQNNGSGGYECIPVELTGRYVKVLCIERATIYGNSLYEIEVYGTEEDEDNGEDPEIHVVITNAQTPNITVQPQPATLTVGENGTLSVTASVTDGGTLSYQWYSNTTNSTTGGTATCTNSNKCRPSTTTAGTFYYYVVVTNTNSTVNGVKTATITSNVVEVTVEQGSSIADIEAQSKLKVYPNPFSGEVHISGAEGSMLQVMDVVGIAVHTQEIYSAEETIKLEFLPTGFYFFRFDNDKTVKMVKLQ